MWSLDPDWHHFFDAIPGTLALVENAIDLVQAEPEPPAPSVICGGFETCVPLTNWPTEFGVWGVDVTEVTEAVQGITPAEGKRMLHFLCTAPDNFPGCDDLGILQSDLHQFVDLSAIADVVASGSAVAHAEVSFNRVAGNRQTDTEFHFRIAAYVGPVGNFRIGEIIDFGSVRFLSDSDPLTWERVSVEFPIPAATEYLGVLLSAVENVSNGDGSEPAFDGHYADDVTLIIMQTCPWDLNGDGTVGIFDLLMLLAAWNADPGGPPDFDGDGNVNVFDLEGDVRRI